MFELLGTGAIPEAWPVIVLPFAGIGLSTVAVMLVVLLLLPIRPPRQPARGVHRLEGTRAA
jgi:hypothetical protein